MIPLSLAILALNALVSVQSPATNHAPLFNGTWTADIARSTMNVRVKASTLDFVVTADTVSITDHVTSLTNQEQGYGTTTFRTDGQPHPHDELMPGLVAVAIWRSDRQLETVLTRSDGLIDRVTYEVSQDGRSLLLRSTGNLGSQVIFFNRTP